MDYSRFIWISNNKKWAIESVKSDEDFTKAWVVDLRKRRGFNVYIEHAKVGDKLLYGGYVTEPFDNVVPDRPIPKYLERQIMEFKEVVTNE